MVWPLPQVIQRRTVADMNSLIITTSRIKIKMIPASRQAKLVAGNPGAWNFGENAPSKFFHAIAVCGQRGLVRRIVGDHAPRRVVIAVIECAILAGDAVDRPHPGNMVAPAGRAASDRRRQQARILQVFKGSIGLGGEPSPRGQGLVDVEQHESDIAPGPGREFRQGSHPG